MSPEHSPETARRDLDKPAGSLEVSQGDTETASPEYSSGRLSLAQRRVLGLQQTIGNRAVMRSVVQRAGGNAPKPAPANQPVPAAHPAPAPPEFAEANHRYSIDFRPPSGQAISVHNITAEEAQRLLIHIAAGIDNFIAAGREGHAYLIHVQSDMWITSTITDLVGGHVIPPFSIWESPFTSMTHARTYMEHGNIRDALQAMHQATRMANNASSRLAQYREDTAQGVAQVQVYLEYTEAAGAVAATVVTGGLAEGVLATAAVAATTAGVYAAAQNAAGQGSEMHSGLRQNFDVGDMLRHSAREAIVGFVAAITGGALKAGFGRIIGRFMQSPNTLVSISNAIGENGPRLAEFIASNLARLSTEFISFIGATTISTAVSNVVTRMIGNARDLAALRRVEAEGFLRQVWQALVQGGITALVIAFLQHTMPTRPAGRAPQVQTPELPPPSGPRALHEPPRPTAQVGETNQPPVDPLAATQPALGTPASAQTPVDPLGVTQAEPQPAGETQATSQADAPASGASPGARRFQLPPMSGLTYEMAQGALRYFRMGGQRAFQRGEYSQSGVGITPNWEQYVANYQIVAGRGATPPPHGWVSPDGYINLYVPHQGNLLGPAEAPPPLPASSQEGAAPAAEPAAPGSASPPAPVDPLAATHAAPGAAAAPFFGGENPVSGNTLMGIGQPGEHEETAPVNTGAGGPEETPRSSRAQTLSGMGGRPYTPLSRQLAQALHEYIGQYHVLQLSTTRVEALSHTAGSNSAPDFNAANQFHEQVQNRVNDLERQIGNVDLIIRARTHNGHSNTNQRGNFQEEFQRLTGNTEAAPEGGFITDDGIIVTFAGRGR